VKGLYSTNNLRIWDFATGRGFFRIVYTYIKMGGKDMDAYKKNFSEFWGIFILIVGSGAVCAIYLLAKAGQPGLCLLGIAVSFGFAVVAIVYALSYIYWLSYKSSNHNLILVHKKAWRRPFLMFFQEKYNLIKRKLWDWHDGLVWKMTEKFTLRSRKRKNF
jgi:hypothetical protein